MTESPKTVDAKTIIGLAKKLRKGYRKSIPLSEWLELRQKPSLLGITITAKEGK